MKKYGVDRKTLKKLAKISPWRSSLRLITEITTIILTAYFTQEYFSYPLYILAVIIIGSREHAIGSLMHEGSHYLLHPNRKVNEFLSYFVASMVYIPFADYRKNHMVHHKYLNTEQDPDIIRRENVTHKWQFPMKRSNYLKILFFDLIGSNFLGMIDEIRYVKTTSTSKDKTQYYILLSFLALKFAFLTYLGLWTEYILYYIVPLFTTAKTIVRFRCVTDHYGIDREQKHGSRDIIYHPILREFLSPCGICYHSTHHASMSVPYYNLPKLFKLIEKNENYQKDCKVTYGIKNLLNEVTYKENSKLRNSTIFA
jgi:fatty acid desaturase